MTSKLKCPVCGKDLIPMTLSSNDNGTLYSSVAFPIKDCICNTSASKKIWQALIQAKQDLEIAKADIEDYKKHNALWEQIRNNTILELERKLEIATKALKDITKEHSAFADWVFKAVTMKGIAEKALEQIEHKEQI